MKKLFFFILGLGLLFFHPTSAADIFNFSNASSDVKIQGTETNDYGVVFYLGHPNFTTTSAQVFLELHPVLSSCSDCKLALYVFDDSAYSSNTDVSVIHSFTGDETTTIKVWADTTLNFDVTKYYALSFYHSLGTPNNNIIKGTAGGSYSGGTWWGAGISRYSGDPFFCIGEDNSTGTEPIANCGTPFSPPAETINFLFPIPPTSTVPWFDYFKTHISNLEEDKNYKIVLDFYDQNNDGFAAPSITRDMLDHGTSTSWDYYIQKIGSLANVRSDNEFRARAFLYKNIDIGIFSTWTPIAVATTTFHYDPTTPFPTSTQFASITFSNMDGTTRPGSLSYGINPPVTPSGTLILDTSSTSLCGIPHDTIPEGIAWAGCKIFEFALVPGKYTSSTAYFADNVEYLKSVVPFSIFFGTIDNIKTFIATSAQASTTLAIQVPMPGGSVTSTNIVIASPTFARDQIGNNIWNAYTNLFLLGLGAFNIAGVVALVFIL